MGPMEQALFSGHFGARKHATKLLSPAHPLPQLHDLGSVMPPVQACIGRVASSVSTPRSPTLSFSKRRRTPIGTNTISWTLHKQLPKLHLTVPSGVAPPHLQGQYVECDPRCSRLDPGGHGFRSPAAASDHHHRHRPPSAVSSRRNRSSMLPLADLASKILRARQYHFQVLECFGSSSYSYRSA